MNSIKTMRPTSNHGDYNCPLIAVYRDLPEPLAKFCWELDQTYLQFFTKYQNTARNVKDTIYNMLHEHAKNEIVKDRTHGETARRFLPWFLHSQ